MGRGARGVRGMTLSGDDAVVSMVAIDPGQSLLTVCENGFGKRTGIEAYRKTRRGGKGVINIRTTERNGRVVVILAVSDADELMMITAKGIMLRTDLSAVREIGRATQGIRLIRPDEGDNVVAVAKIVPENGDAQPDTGAGKAEDEPMEGGTEPGEAQTPDSNTP